MTRADQIKAAFNTGEMNFTDCLIEANEIGDAYEEDYDNEITYIELADNSVIVLCGMTQEIHTYGCRE